VLTNDLDLITKKIFKLHKMIRFIAILNKNGKIVKSKMRDDIPSLLKTKNEERFCKDVTIRRGMREEFDKSLGKVRFVNVERENVSQIVLYAKTKSLFVTLEPEILVSEKVKIISQIKKLTNNLK
tara:strand:- start:11282 stop:11656 length:375 start_codon:yes stop_codon:yes gene_type:complete